MGNWPPESPDDLRRVVEERLEEETRIEFKRALPASGQNDSVAKAITAMANADGGVIVYGIEEQDGKAAALAPFDLAGTPERVDLIARTVDEPVKLTLLRPIVMEGDGRGCLVVEVPRSPRAPHFYKGTAWARSVRTTGYLSRRDAGERFARSPGFAQEFGLAVQRGGRLRFETQTEFRPSSGKSNPLEHFFVFENDGDAEVHDADWHFGDEDEKSIGLLDTDPFPISTFHPSQRLVLKVLPSDVEYTVSVVTSWKDLGGVEHEIEWPVTWG